MRCKLERFLAHEKGNTATLPAAKPTFWAHVVAVKVGMRKTVF